MTSWRRLAPLLALLAAMPATPAAAQISPGPLSRAHRHLNGATGCMRCHAVNAGKPEFRCLDCHREIAARLAQHRGLHPNLMDPAAGSAACVRCHSEHNGEDFALIRWNPAPGSFDHSKTGFPLDGKHAGLACKQCHNAKNIAAPERAQLLATDFSRTFLGLSRTCTSCHEDKHGGRLGANCLQCHGTSDWKSVHNFDHAKTRFPLTGAHAQVGCAKCHTAGPDGAPRYAGLKFDTCSSCHSDPHRGQFQQSCSSCHTTAAWKRTLSTFAFDHAKTKFPLLGKHAGLECSACHRGGDFKAEIRFQSCSDCHKDYHQGQFAQRADGGKCESCHTVEGFKPAKFGIPEHAATPYPLQGRHATVACAKCHLPAGAATRFVGLKFSQCLDCHQDAHKGQFAAAPYNNRCEQCHSIAGFHPADFTLTRHQKTAFPLTGSHLAVACIDCHKDSAALGTAVFHFQGLACTTCHADPHRGEFQARMAALNSRGRPAGCEACHTTKTWRDLAAFDHGSTAFPLSGTHRAVECIGCHRPPNLERGLLNVNFKAAPTACESCHDNPHATQFAGNDGVTRCARCHNAMKWRPSLFDHETTKFPLQGAHQNVACKACHTALRTFEDNPVLYYAPTPTACAACHAASVTPNGT